ncbi:MAG: CPBP family glutamic-type intramembrane protease [Zavarzinella sp.]
MSYFESVKHPWPILIFLLPLLAVYEVGVMKLSHGSTEVLRNGADVWFRWGLEKFGLREVLAAPAIIVAVLLVRALWRWSDRPNSLISSIFGMAIEGIFFAGLLWLVARNFANLLKQVGVPLQALNFQLTPETYEKIIMYAGAGIYEEVLFRVILFGGLLLILRLMFLPSLIAVPIAAVLSAVTFALAHHIGPHGESFSDPGFRFRLYFRIFAGLYFALLYRTRGFGIAVGTHMMYDVLAGLEMKN